MREADCDCDHSFFILIVCSSFDEDLFPVRS